MKEIQKNPESKYKVIGFSHKNKYYIKFYDVICICGKENKLTAQDLKKNISCGCCKKMNICQLINFQNHLNTNLGSQ